MSVHKSILFKYDQTHIGDLSPLYRAIDKALGLQLKEDGASPNFFVVGTEGDNKAFQSLSETQGIACYSLDNIIDIPHNTCGNRIIILPGDAGGFLENNPTWSMERGRLKSKLDELLQEERKRIAIWGAGHVARMTFFNLNLPPDLEIVAVVDRNPALWGSLFAGVTIRSVESLSKTACDIVLVLIRGHQVSRTKQQKLLPEHHFWSLYQDGDPQEDGPLDLAKILEGKGYSSEREIYDLRKWDVWLGGRDAFVDRLQSCFLEDWRERLMEAIRAVGEMEDKIRCANWGTALWFLSETYDKVGALTNTIVPFHQVYSKGLGKYFEILGWEKSCLRETGISLTGKNVLDIGFGESLMNAVMLLLEGCEKVVAVDPGARRKVCENWFSYAIPLFWYMFGDLANDSEKQKAFELLPRILQGIDFSTGRIKFDGSHVDVRYDGVENLKDLENTIDIAFSHSVFEHVNNPGAAVQSLSRLLKSGGYAFISIDYKPHSDPDVHLFSLYKNPFKPVADYANEYGVQLNLHRTPHFMRLFKESGLEVIAYIPGERSQYTQDLVDRIHPSFSDVPVHFLCEQGATFYLRKPPVTGLED